MGLFSSSIDKFCERCLTHSIWTLAVAGALSFMSLSVVVNVLRQLLFKCPHEPPVVFHWFPFIGSTVNYGIDPYKFFFSCREKVCS
jgi:divalent metal cation (Fe/Co/Zn/Cd) transporter